jgi:glycosyltransferase involved in cell wall biosynthesis
MRAIILADASFAARERAMLSRLEVGLADEGIRIVHAVPERSAHWHHGQVFSQQLTYKDEGLPLSLRWRVRQFAGELEALEPAAARLADVVHVFGAGAWEFGSELAMQIGAVLAVEVWAADLVRPAVRQRYGPEHLPALCLAPDAAMEGLLHNASGSSSPIRQTPWGVHTPSSSREILPDGRAWSAFIVGSGRDTHAMLGALEGLAAAAADFPDLMIFADADGMMRSNLWPTVKRLGLVDRLSMIPDAEARRDPVLRGDLLLVPEALGEHRSLTLDAMAAGMLVVAAADASDTVLSDGRITRLIDRRTSEGWQAALSQILSQPESAREVALAGRAFVKENRRASNHVAAVTDVYEWLTAGETIPFNPA